MPLVRINTNLITDWGSFHDVFARTLGFPESYGRNMNAWIDCMTCLDDAEACMSSVHGPPTDPVVLQIDAVNNLPQDIYESLVECAAFVNWRRIEQGDQAILVLSFHRTAQ